jgi:DNA primase
MDKATIIRQSLSMRNVAEYYGFTINNRSFISCPFHAEKSCSCKIYSGVRGFSCFGCGKSGSVIDFVMNLFQIDFRQALLRLDSDFGLNLSNEKVDMKVVNEYKRKQEEKKKYNDKMNLIEEWWLIQFKRQYKLFHLLKPKDRFEELSDEFIQVLKELPYTEKQNERLIEKR